MLNRRAFLAGVSAAASAGTFAQSAKVTKIVVGFSAGGPVDSVARIYADELRNAGLGTFIVENKAGAGGRLAVQAVKAAAADGSTLLLTPSSILTIYPHIYKKLPYDPVKDLAPIGTAVDYSFALAVGPGAPVKTLAEFVEWAKKNPKAASFGSPGAGTGPHFLGVMFGKAAAAPMTHVPYRGGANSVQDVVGGQLPALWATLPALLPQYRAGKIRILAHTDEKRIASLPDVPTFKELGYKDLDMREWFGFFAPTGTPQTAIAPLQAAISAAAAKASVREALAKQGFEASHGDAARLAALVKSDLDSWSSIVRLTGFTPEE